MIFLFEILNVKRYVFVILTTDLETIKLCGLAHKEQLMWIADDKLFIDAWKDHVRGIQNKMI